MARPKRMGAYNALDELPPPPAPPPPDAEEPSGRVTGVRAWLEPVPDPAPPPRSGPPRRSRVYNALDEMLPGPGQPKSAGSPRPRLQPVPDPGWLPRAGGPRQHLSAWNPLDELPKPAPATAGPGHERVRASFRLPADLVEAARDAVAHLAGTPGRTTIAALAERALRAELARLSAAHNGGRPFPRRPPSR
ncbi:MAG TPA: hypothetical protein VGR68_02570 [Actinomycetota bacterium]|nr:hypothetical protein [Actinomycetota bacterium]